MRRPAESFMVSGASVELEFPAPVHGPSYTQKETNVGVHALQKQMVKPIAISTVIEDITS